MQPAGGKGLVKALSLASRHCRSAWSSSGTSGSGDRGLYKFLYKRTILSNAFKAETGLDVPADVGKQVSLG